MTEFLQNLNLQDLWLTIVGFISVNGMTIIGLIIAWVKEKIKRGIELDLIKNENKDAQEKVIHSCDEALARVEKTIKELENRINDAIKVAEEAEKKEIEAKSIKLNETLNEAKAQTLSLTEELSKL